MATLAVSIQTMIDALDAQFATISPTSVSSDGTSIQNPEWTKLVDKRLALEEYKNRLSGASPMFARGVVTGLRGR